MKYVGPNERILNVKTFTIARKSKFRRKLKNKGFLTTAHSQIYEVKIKKKRTHDRRCLTFLLPLSMPMTRPPTC